MPEEPLNAITRYPDEAEAVIIQLFAKPDKMVTSLPKPEMAVIPPNSMPSIVVFTIKDRHCENSRSSTGPNPMSKDELPEKLHLGRFACHAVSTVTGKGVAGKVKLQFC